MKKKNEEKAAKNNKSIRQKHSQIRSQSCQCYNLCVQIIKTEKQG